MIGHGLGAAGGLEAIATIKAITTGWLHPTLNQHVKNKHIYIFHVFFYYYYQPGVLILALDVVCRTWKVT